MHVLKRSNIRKNYNNAKIAKCNYEIYVNQSRIDRGENIATYHYKLRVNNLKIALRQSPLRAIMEYELTKQ